MAYVEAHAGLRDHLKTKKVARLLSIPKVQVIGHMLCLWWWCQEYAQDGDLSNFDVADIADAAEYEGDPQTFVDALLNCGVKGGAGFLWRDGNNALVINDWYQYGGKLFVQRAQSAERMRKKRERDGNKTDGYADVTRNEAVTVTHVTPIDKIRVDIDTTSADAAPTAKKSKAPKPKKDGAPLPQQELFGAVCACVGWDHKTITGDQAGQVAQTAGVLKDAGYDIADLRTFWRWWHEEDWRGQKGQYPTLIQLRTEIGKIRSLSPLPQTNGTVQGFDVSAIIGG